MDTYAFMKQPLEEDISELLEKSLSCCSSVDCIWSQASAAFGLYICDKESRPALFKLVCQ